MNLKVGQNWIQTQFSHWLSVFPIMAAKLISNLSPNYLPPKLNLKQPSILFYLMILWVRNLDGTQLIDFSAPCDIDWGHTVVLGCKMGWSIWCLRWFHVYVWHLEVWNQGISRYILPLKALRKDSSFLIFKIIYSLRLHRVVCGILVLQPGTETLPPALGTWSLNH